MKRLEIIACRTAEKEIINALRNTIQDLYYSLIPQIPGNDEPDYQQKIVWTKLNFLLICFLDEQDVIIAQTAIKAVKEKIPSVKIKTFFSDVSICSLSTASI